MKPGDLCWWPRREYEAGVVEAIRGKWVGVFVGRSSLQKVRPVVWFRHGTVLPRQAGEAVCPGRSPQCLAG